MTLYWSKDRPTRVGWYFTRWNGQVETTKVFKQVDESAELWGVDFGDRDVDDAILVTEYSRFCEWAGPIEMPQEGPPPSDDTLPEPPRFRACPACASVSIAARWDNGWYFTCENCRNIWGNLYNPVSVKETLE